MPLRQVREVRAVRRDVLAWLVGAVGAALCLLGWVGVSGERFTARQVPYLASATVPGAAMVVAAAVLLAHADTARRVAELHRLLVEEEGTAGAEDGGEGTRQDARWLAVPGGTVRHRAGCPLVAGKDEAEALDAARAAGRGLAPCPVCAPEAPGTSGTSGAHDPGRP